MSARLSPAASLLRNSKLFALPPAITLPPAPPSADQISSSDTATTIHPQYASIVTTTSSGSQGDWGFKRPLPAKTTKSTNNPIVRLVNGIDTKEHVADFESAADHTLSLRKFQELNVPVQLPSFERYSIGTVLGSSFNPAYDNTTNLASTAPFRAGRSGVWPDVRSEDVAQRLPDKVKQKAVEYELKQKASQNEGAGMDARSGASQLERATQKTTRMGRWRYSGPSLLQISGQDFDEYLGSLGKKEKERLHDRIKQDIVQNRTIRARESGNIGQSVRQEDITEEDVQHRLRHLRNAPRKFGPLLAEILDLPFVAANSWEYGHDTLAAQQWRETGPPRTHPSAGLSYLANDKFSINHPTYGPQKKKQGAVARAVKMKFGTGSRSNTSFGVAGFIVESPDNGHLRQKTDQFVPQSGGNKIAVIPGLTYIQSDGSLKMHTSSADGQEVVNERVVDRNSNTTRSPMSAHRQTGPAPVFNPRPIAAQQRQVRAEPEVDIDAILAGPPRQARKLARV